MIASPSRLRLALRLNSVLWARPFVLERILAASRGDESFLQHPPREAAAACGLHEPLVEKIFEEARLFDAEREISRLDRLGALVVVAGDSAYPELLRGIQDAPLLLYVQGRIPSSPRAAAIVGSRRPTPYGLRMAAHLASGCAKLGIAVASGLARGIDAAAHAAALDAGGETWAVLGSGLSQVYPPEHSRLALKIIDSGGTIVSEFPLDTPPFAQHFPRRNRVISGLSPACVVVEGRMKSGSLITAKCALDQGREVFAVPGPALSPLSEAPHYLIESGARPIANASDLGETLPDRSHALPPLSRSQDSGSKPASLSPTGRAGIDKGRGEEEDPAASGGMRGLPQRWRKILRFLGFDDASFEEIREALGGEDSPAVLKTLSEMEIDGLISRLPGQRYAQK